MQIIDKYFSYLKGKSIENPNLTKSLILHFIIVLAVSGMLPTCTRKIEKPKIIAIDILPMGNAEKVEPKEVKKETPKKEPPKPLPPKEVKKPADAVKMEKAEKPKPVAKPEEKKLAPKKTEKKPEPEKEKKPQDKQKKDDRDQEGKKKLLKDLEKKDQESLENIFDEATKSDPVADAALVNEIMGKIQSQVTQNWNIPIGVKDAQNIKVRLYIALARDGTVTQVKILDQIQYSTDNIYRVAADTAVWAVKESSPIQGLPVDKYDMWKEIEFSFDPSEVL